MARKKILRIPKLVTLTCLQCGKKSKRNVPEDASPQYFDCDGCGQRTQTPVTACCMICAFTGKKCAPALRMEAKMNGLEIR